MLSALREHFHPVLLTEADWPGEMIRIHTGVGNISWSGKTWIGAGNLVQFAAPEETGGLAASEATVKVAAMLEDMLAERGKVIRNRSIQIWIGVTTEPAGNVLAHTPVKLFTGYFDSRTAMIGRGDTEMSHDMVLGLGTGPGARSAASITHSYEDQLANYPGDTAGRHVQNANKHRYNTQQWPEP